MNQAQVGSKPDPLAFSPVVCSGGYLFSSGGPTATTPPPPPIFTLGAALNYAETSSAREWSRLGTNYGNLSSHLSQSMRSRTDWTKSGATKVRDKHHARHPQVQIVELQLRSKKPRRSHLLATPAACGLLE